MINNIREEFHKVHFDYCAFAQLDFNSNTFISHSLKKVEKEIADAPHIFYDLASITKPLTLSVHYLKDTKSFTPDDVLLLNHRGGLPSWGRISHSNWRNVILGYKIYEAPVLYSDYSALRLMLELSPKFKKNFQEECASYWAPDVYFWKDLPAKSESPITGYRQGEAISGVVHDDNAFVIDEFCSHAGLFSTIKALSETLLSLGKKWNLLKALGEAEKKDKAKNRYILGFDRVTDLEKTLAGKGASIHTFGHLGFTGTSFWIDLEKSKGTILLTNGVRGHWYARDQLNGFRRKVGEILWKSI